FFVGPAYMVSVHDGHSESVNELRDHATRNPKILGEGPVSLLHRIVDSMVDHYRPEMDKFEDRLDQIEKEVFDAPDSRLMRRILAEKRQVARSEERRVGKEGRGGWAGDRWKER